MPPGSLLTAMVLGQNRRQLTRLAETPNICLIKGASRRERWNQTGFRAHSGTFRFFRCLHPVRIGDGLTMNSRVEQCLAHVREAEEHANEAVDGYVRESWLAIANSYRQLAQVRLSLVPEPASEPR